MNGTSDAPPRIDALSEALEAWQKTPNTATENRLWDELTPFVECVVGRFLFARPGATRGRDRRAASLDFQQDIHCALLQDDRKVLRAWSRDSGTARGFLWAVILNKLKGLNGLVRYRALGDDDVPELGDWRTPEDLLSRAAADALLRDLVYEAATPAELEVFHLVYEQGLSLEDAARQSNKSADAVAARHMTLKRRVAKLLRATSSKSAGITRGLLGAARGFLRPSPRH